MNSHLKITIGILVIMMLASLRMNLNTYLIINKMKDQFDATADSIEAANKKIISLKTRLDTLSKIGKADKCK